MEESMQAIKDLEAAYKAVTAIKQLCRDLDLPEKLREIKATEGKLSEMAKL